MTDHQFIACLCPACRTRRHGLVDLNCPVCHGTGALELGPAALRHHEPAVIAAAVAVIIEAAAREAEQHLGAELRDLALRRAGEQCRVAGLLWPPPVESPAPIPAGTDLTTLGISAPAPYDSAVIESAPFDYEPTDRPNQRGAPLLSASGHASHTARIVDPADGERPTTAVVYERHAQQRKAQTLAAAARRVANTREKSKRR